MKNARNMLLTMTAILVLTPSVTFAQCETRCLVGASASASGDLLALFWSPPSTNLKNLEVDNVSRLVSQRVVGPVTRWQVPDGPFTVEHLAGVNPSGDLLVFFWSTSPGAQWQVVNISAISGGHQVVGPVTNWQTQDGPFTVEHLAGVSPSGDLLIFFWSPRADWQVINVSDITREQVINIWATNTGQQVASGAVITGQQVLGIGPVDGQVHGQQVVGPVANWQTQDGPFTPFTVEHLAGVNSSGDLLVFFWSPQADWKVINVSRDIRNAGGVVPKIISPVTSWQLRGGFSFTFPFTFLTIENLVGVSPSGDLLVFSRTGGATWQVINASQSAQKQVVGPVTNLLNDSAELVATGLDDNVLWVFFNVGFGRQSDPRWGYCNFAITSCTLFR